MKAAVVVVSVVVVVAVAAVVIHAVASAAAACACVMTAWRPWWLEDTACGWLSWYECQNCCHPVSQRFALR